MKREAKTLCKAAGLVALLAASVMSPRASRAGLTYDLRFADGSSTKSVSGPTTLTVELWGRVSGTDTNHANDGLWTNYLVLQSQQINGGAVTGGVASGQTGSAFSVNARNGQANDLNGDGVGDWGGNGLVNTDENYMLARADTPGAFGGGSIGQAVDANTWEFHVATYTIGVSGTVPGAGGDAETRFAVVQPAFPTSPLPSSYAVYFEDGSGQIFVNSTNSDSVYGDYVTIVVPEPTTLAFAALGGLALLARRRR